MWLTSDFGSQMRNKRRGKSAIRKLWSEWKTKPGRETMFKLMAKKDPEFLRAIRTDVTETFINAIDYAIRNEENIIPMIEAPQGEAKSSLGMEIMRLWIERFEIINDRKVNYFFTFNIPDTKDKLPKTKNGDYIQIDEATKSVGEGSGTAETEMQNLVETMRSTQKCLNVCSPKIVILHGMNMLFRPFGKFKKYDKTKKITDKKIRFIWYQLEEKPGSHRFMPIGYVILDMKCSKEMIKKYEKAKAKNYRFLEKNGGASGVNHTVALNKWKKIALKVLKKAMDEGWPRTNPPSKKALDNYVWALNIKGSNKEIEILKMETVKAYDDLMDEKKKQQQDQDLLLQQQDQIDNEFTWNEQVFLNEIKAESKSDQIERNIQIYKDCIYGTKTKDQLMIEHKLTSAVRISQIKNQIMGKVSQRVGKDFEEFLNPQLKKIFDKVVQLAGKGEPDFLCYKNGQLYIFSIKCLHFARGSYSLSYKESNPEINYGRQYYIETGKDPIIICYVYNIYNQKIYEHYFDSNIYKNNAPFSKRNIQLNLSAFTRDPKISPWIQI